MVDVRLLPRTFRSRPWYNFRDRVGCQLIVVELTTGDGGALRETVLRGDVLVFDGEESQVVGPDDILAHLQPQDEEAELLLKRIARSAE